MAAGELASEGPSTGPVSALACPLVPTETGGGQGGGWSKRGPDLGSQHRAWTWQGRQLLRLPGPEEGPGMGAEG